MEEYLSNLNPNQRQAVIETKGPILVIAGAGAGKTKVVTHRILHLIKNGVAPSNILAITFTNKAASEMRQRVEELLSKDSQINKPVNFYERPFIGTFHSLGVKIIRDNFKEAKVAKSFKILDRNDAIRIIKQSMQLSGIDPKSFEPNKILSVISRKKGDFINSDEFANSSDIGYFGKLVSKVWKKYEEIKTSENALDFDDLLLISAQILKNNKEILEKHLTKKQLFILKGKGLVLKN
jgi:DNA helicase-2/ATP-dependent DNA helicase PcrA